VAHPRGEEVDIVAASKVDRDPLAVACPEQPARATSRDAPLGSDPEDLRALAQQRRSVDGEVGAEGRGGLVERTLGGRDRRAQLNTSPPLTSSD
jgi:hypothetical protein